MCKGHLEVETIEAAEAEGLSGAALEDHVERSLPPLVAVRLRDDARHARGHAAVHVGDGRGQRDLAGQMARVRIWPSHDLGILVLPILYGV